MVKEFKDRKELHLFFQVEGKSHEGFWIQFDKSDVEHKLTPQEALEEALCFGWIDSTIKKIDDRHYIKYFARRRKNSNWSNRNKDIVKSLIEKDLMMPEGLLEVDMAKKDGRWDDSDRDFSPSEYVHFEDLIQKHQDAYLYYKSLSKSKQRTYAISYLSLKRDDSRARRLAVIIDRLIHHQDPM